MGIAGQITGKLKNYIKAKGYTYKTLASRLEISESALKRNFSIGDFSLSRLEEICRVLDITLADLAKYGEDHTRVSFLTEDQELELAADERLFVVFYLVNQFI